MPGILVFGEIHDGVLGSITGELIAAGRLLADGLNESVAVVLPSDDAQGQAGEAIALGADRVYTVSHPLLSTAQPDLQLAALEQVCQMTAPSVVLIGKNGGG